MLEWDGVGVGMERSKVFSWHEDITLGEEIRGMEMIFLKPLSLSRFLSLWK